MLETLVTEFDDFSETTFRFIVFSLVEWHENKILRHHIMANLLELFKNEKVLSLQQLIEPLCSIIN